MLLLITGCIQVDESIPYISIVNQEMRYQGYLYTLRWASKCGAFNKVVFCENSGFEMKDESITDMFIANDIEYEYLTFIGDKKKTIKRGKGYGEGEIIEYAIKNSKLVKKEKGFFKITGRLTIRNILQLVKEYDADCIFNRNLLAVDCVDTRFYYCNKDIYLKELLHIYYNINDKAGLSMEKIYYEKLKELNLLSTGFNHYPIFLGKSGSLGYSYDGELKISVWMYELFARMNVYNSEFVQRYMSIFYRYDKKRKLKDVQKHGKNK